ncbi:MULTISPECIES: YezD family protein [Clostridium]|uniref:YezD family protein n=1 Tax=Clostridium TaxID=1485 RepID=UPI000A01A7F3|nr:MULTISPECIES: YezD family protein [Clostridium]MCD2348897.1 YezD family protein [Clostridium guangxiense]
MNDKNIRVIKNNEINNYTNKISELLKDIKYGSITLVIQDGVVIQIETSEKIRLK